MPFAGAGPSQDGLAAILTEIRGLRLVQDEILSLLRNGPSPLPSVGESFELPPEPRIEAAFEPPPIRKRRRKTVLLVDDQEQTRREALAALEAAEVPTRAVTDGRAALEAIAAEKPDIIAIDLAVDGPMAGKDVINMIKATMEWVDIPIILYTRLPIASQKEARTLHGGDELVLKGPGSAQTLVTRVIQVFRRP
jgi:CheY-like chemotaxis protein